MTTEGVNSRTGVNRIDGLLAYRGEVLPPGPWHSEPDHEQFEAGGFPCIAHRNASWCGYVGVPPGHPWHGKSYDDCLVGEDAYPDVHGGLTYADKCQGPICHVAKPGEPDDVWWVGFDCNHSGDAGIWDIAGGRLNMYPSYNVYRDLSYVKAETAKLAAQAKSVADEQQARLDDIRRCTEVLP